MLKKDHPALGAFRKKKLKLPPDWRYIANELASELRPRMAHEDHEGKCTCTAHITLRVFEEACLHTVYGDSRI